MRPLTKNALASALAIGLVSVAHAASYTVNSSADPVSGNALNCSAGNLNTCTLRDAIAAAGNGDAIGFSTDMTISLVSGHTLVVTKSISITGSGHAIVLDGNHSVSVLSVYPNTTVTIDHLAIQHGSTISGGGGVSNYGTLTLSNDTISNNGTAGYGGGIYNKGTLTVADTTVAGNVVGHGGGGISTMAPSGTVTLARSTVSGNQGHWGGGIFASAGSLNVANSTISGNTATIGPGGGISNLINSTLTLINSTISGNTAPSAGSGVYNAGAATFANTIVADGCHVATGATQTDNGYNIDSGTSCRFQYSFTNTDAMLGPLGDHGGPTQTQVPQWGSLAIDNGSDFVCGAAPVNGVDQRGVARPQGAFCDIGAVEWEVADDTIFTNGFE